MILNSQFLILNSGFEIPFDQSHLIFKAALQRGSAIIPSPCPLLHILFSLNVRSSPHCHGGQSLEGMLRMLSF
jgi:hypothetical protein